MGFITTDKFTILELNKSAINDSHVGKDYHVELKCLLEGSLDKLGTVPKRTILSYLFSQGISFEEKKCSSVDDIEHALRKLLGTGSELILDSNWKQEVAQMRVED
jgi:predicted AlkP superfamily phosphohydrolase/phosphomutase